MAKATLEERVAALERQFTAFLANRLGTGPTKNWRRTRGVFTGDDLMKQVFAEGRKMRRADRDRAQSRTASKRRSRS